jgi:hypothetical protein
MGNVNDHISEKISWQHALARCVMCAAGGIMVGLALGVWLVDWLQ